ncbi:MAG TPA: hypothetical protein VFF58_00620 [Candidatus Nitrosotalea sp.]|nr:hypothetical protein [Candidatus Nitrosotalea sp.]
MKSEAAAKGFKGKRAARYVYGAMNNMGAMRGNKETAKGAAMQVKHESDQKKRMKSDIAKFHGTSSEHSFRRPTRRTLRHTV